MNRINWRYWTCQLIGWGTWALFNIYLFLFVYREMFNTQYGTPGNEGKVKGLVFSSIFITFSTCLLVSHLLRTLLNKTDWLRFSFNRILVIFIVGTVAAGFSSYFLSNFLEKKAGVSLQEIRKNKQLVKAEEIEKKFAIDKSNYFSDTATKKPTVDTLVNKIKISTGWHRNKNGKWVFQESSLLSVFQFIILNALWLLIYLMWHYIERNRKTQVANLKLETTVKELELKTIKAHVNPHFIFNSLNSIRALVDENPERARKAITELSNLLRSSMIAEKNETVPLEKELKIVEDYLALEKIRFEDRLNVSFDIDEDTLDQQVPPMMLQTLVENAIKHGISKEVNGGFVIIKSDFVDSHYELSVENTGKLTTTLTHNDGFGLKSTQDRLQLLYGKNTSFNISQHTENSVIVKVIFPIRIN